MGLKTRGIGRIRRALAHVGIVVWALLLAQVVHSSRARANIRAPLVEPQSPSSAALPLGSREDVRVLGETLSFRCGDVACDVEARYRVEARQAVTTELAFVLPSATLISVRVGTTETSATVAAAPPKALREEDVQVMEHAAMERLHVPILQARFSANLAAGENAIVVFYQQPLGRREYGHSYFRRGRFVQFFRYELWPLREWKRARSFRIDVEVVIRRPYPSWWKRSFSTSRSVGCRLISPVRGSSLQQRGDDLHFLFALTDPIPGRLWCEIGDEDLVSGP